MSTLTGADDGELQNADEVRFRAHRREILPAEIRNHRLPPWGYGGFISRDTAFFTSDNRTTFYSTHRAGSRAGYKLRSATRFDSIYL